MNYDEDTIKILQEKVWRGSIPLHISLSPAECRTYDDSLPYLVQCPRLAYIPSLLPRLHKFFTSSLIDPEVAFHHGWLSFEGVALKWQQPIGLLYDIFSSTEPVNYIDRDRQKTAYNDNNSGRDHVLPWRLVVHFTEWPHDQLIPLDADGKIYHDSFINSVKEADFLRNGTAKAIMSLSKDDSTRLWDAVQNHDLTQYNLINHKILNKQDGAALRHVPMKIYLPTSPPTNNEEGGTDQTSGTLKVVQSLVKPMISLREPQTMGTALFTLLPTVFPSRRSYIFAHAVLHGAVVPLAAPVEQLMRGAAYADGFLHIHVVMIS